MSRCSAPNCSSSTRIGKQMFRFPQDPVRKKKWVVNCRLGFEPVPHSRLCQDHFEHSQFEKIARSPSGGKKLKPNAIPTLFSTGDPPDPTPHICLSDEPEPDHEETTGLLPSPTETLFHIKVEDPDEEMLSACSERALGEEGSPPHPEPVVSTAKPIGSQTELKPNAVPILFGMRDPTYPGDTTSYIWEPIKPEPEPDHEETTGLLPSPTETLFHIKVEDADEEMLSACSERALGEEGSPPHPEPVVSTAKPIGSQTELKPNAVPTLFGVRDPTYPGDTTSYILEPIKPEPDHEETTGLLPSPTETRFHIKVEDPDEEMLSACSERALGEEGSPPHPEPVVSTAKPIASQTHDSGADIYKESSSSGEEDLIEEYLGDSDPDYIPNESDDDDEDEDESSLSASRTSPHPATASTLSPPLQTYSSDDSDGSDDSDDEPAPSTSAQVNRLCRSPPASVSPPHLETPSRSSQVKRRRAAAPHAPPSSACSKKRKAKHGQAGSASTVRVEGEDERWRNKEEPDTRPNPKRFTPARTPGLQLDTRVPWSPFSLFKLFFSTSVVRTIISNTNANAAKRQKAGRKFKWTPLTESDFWVFMSIILYSGLVQIHQRSDYWRSEWPYGFAFPSNTMGRDRFEAIMFSLHLSNPADDEENQKKRNTDEYDRLFKIKPLYNDIVAACQAYFHPHENICIDERMVASKARHSMKQYMKDKPIKWGYKIFVLADSATAYTFNFFVYQGKSKSSTAHGLGFSSVWDLLPFKTLGGGYKLYVDNFYTSPHLFQELLKKNIHCCGTIRRSCVGYPKVEVNTLPKNAERGDMRWLRRGNLLFVKWKDSKEVNMCTTVHEAFSGQTVNRVVKKAGVWGTKTLAVPSSIVDYNRFMGGVDLSDALIKYYTVHHKTTKWYKTFFYHFIDVAVVNSFILFKELCKLKNEKPLTQKVFREKLGKEMLTMGKGSAPPAPPRVTCMPEYFGPGDIEGDDKRKYCQRCQNAGQKRVKTRIYCRKCKVALCFVNERNCFAEWHDASR